MEAFATSPQGLGLSIEDFWLLSSGEFDARKAVHDGPVHLWAITQSMFANANFRSGDQVAFMPEDFLGTGDRPKRQADQLVSRMEAVKENSRLLKMRAGEPPTDDVPDWARA